MNLQKTKAWRSKKYLDWIREQQCAYCINQTTKTEAHHIKGVGCMSGTGQKAPDYATMPLCNSCHREMHGNPEIQGEQWEMIVRTLGKAIDEGILKEYLIPF